MKPALFALTGSGEFEPTHFAGSHWGDDHLNGPAVVGLVARTLELHYGSPDFMPTRLTRRFVSGCTRCFDRRDVPCRA